MNAKQRGILIVAAATIAVMLVFPPFHFYLGEDGGKETNLGYSFILRPPVLVPPSQGPNRGVIANVHWQLLLMQWVGVVLVATMLWLAVKD